ncbi:sensor histidine kinase [Krasilnikoviella flava]|uniref:histidine kinase n=1 Tax=Krasilnikoviella flava TaxID=526729 RepID=A0A1T5ILG6_9MICO|nr:histidine kinase [Krasilnikoviella flava]SKC39912.1 Signal transduction histidine kinase [Krasilnikoviella flava]
MTPVPARGDVVLAAVAAVALLPATAVIVYRSLPAGTATALVALAAVAHLATAWRRAAPVTSHLLVLAALAGQLALTGLFLLLPSALLVWLSVAACAAWSARPWLPAATGVVGVAAAVLRYAGDPAVRDSGFGPAPWLLGLLLLALLAASWTAGLLRRAQDAARRATEERHAAAVAEQDVRAERAALAERARIAREMHDVVAHSLAVVVAQARLGQAAPARAQEALAAVEEAGRSASRELRSLLHVLRTGPDADAGGDRPAPGLDDLPALVARVRAAGRAVDLDVAGESRPLGPAAQLAVYRVVQESLTNTARHAGAGAASRVALTWGDDGLEVVVADDGGTPAPSTAHEGAGTGLHGMRERVESVGGRLDVRRDGGWAVVATLPAGPEPVSGEAS